MIVNTIYESSDTTNGDAEMIVNTIYESSDTGAPHTRNLHLPSGNPYEDVNFVGSVPSVTSEKHAPAPNFSKDDKDKTSGATPLADDSSLYATVDKSKTAVLPVAPKNGAVGKPGVKPKPHKKGKQDSLGQNTDKKKEVYSNTALLSMKPQETDVEVYENCGFLQDEASAAKKPESSETSPSGNPDVLVYTTIAFTRDQKKKAKQPPPERETTEYVDIDFGKLVR
ncbi:uncharacterized protein [Littorina saxatilis]|uniref:uncharacterized protein n=1 Tax=Littorina saxatilis TaxID=31220 RepID=UPI0038B4D91E